MLTSNNKQQNSGIFFSSRQVLLRLILLPVGLNADIASSSLPYNCVNYYFTRIAVIRVKLVCLQSLHVPIIAEARKKEEGRRKTEARKKEEGRRKREEGRRKKEEGRRKREEGFAVSVSRRKGGFRDVYAQFQSRNIAVLGVSTDDA